MFCYKCGSKLPEGSVFCNKCGIKQPDLADYNKTKNIPQKTVSNSTPSRSPAPAPVPSKKDVFKMIISDKNHFSNKHMVVPPDNLPVSTKIRKRLFLSGGYDILEDIPAVPYMKANNIIGLRPWQDTAYFNVKSPVYVTLNLDLEEQQKLEEAIRERKDSKEVDKREIIGFGVLNDNSLFAVYTRDYTAYSRIHELGDEEWADVKVTENIKRICIVKYADGKWSDEKTIENIVMKYVSKDPCSIYDSNVTRFTEENISIYIYAHLVFVKKTDISDGAAKESWTICNAYDGSTTAMSSFPVKELEEQFLK